MSKIIAELEKEQMILQMLRPTLLLPGQNSFQIPEAVKTLRPYA